MCVGVWMLLLIIVIITRVVLLYVLLLSERCLQLRPFVSRALCGKRLSQVLLRSR